MSSFLYFIVLCLFSSDVLYKHINLALLLITKFDLEICQIDQAVNQPQIMGLGQEQPVLTSVAGDNDVLESTTPTAGHLLGKVIFECTYN